MYPPPPVNGHCLPGKKVCRTKEDCAVQCTVYTLSPYLGQLVLSGTQSHVATDRNHNPCLVLFFEIIACNIAPARTQKPHIYPTVNSVSTPDNSLAVGRSL